MYFLIFLFIRSAENTLFSTLLASGAEGNRTPVRKSIHYGISHYSYSFDIPSTARRVTGLQLQ